MSLIILNLIYTVDNNSLKLSYFSEAGLMFVNRFFVFNDYVSVCFYPLVFVGQVFKPL